MMRVLWTHNFNPRRQNAGCYLYDVVPALQRIGVRVDFEYLGNLRNPRDLAKGVARVRQLAEGYDLVHAQYGSACGWVTSKLKSKPVVVSIRGNDWNTHDQSLSFAFFHTRLARWMTRAALPSVQGVVAVSRRMRLSLRSHLRNQRVLIQPSPIDLRKWQPADPDDTSPRTGKREYRVLFVALKPTDPIKRYDLARSVVESANRRIGNVKLSLATGIPFAEMPQFVRGHDAMLCLSESEGWPNSVKESLACNVPFVACDVSDLREIAAVEATCRVCRSDVEDLAGNLCEVLTLPRSPTLRRHVEWMGIEESADRIRTFYLELLEARANRAPKQPMR